MPGSIGPGELIIVLVIALIVLGPKRLPEVGRHGLARGRAVVAGDGLDDPPVLAPPVPNTTSLPPP